MKTKIHLHGAVCGLALFSTLNLQPSTCCAQGGLTPPGPPGATMLTLSQMEPRTPIASAPYTITQPGSYYLANNLTVSGGNAIAIAANGVTLDLNGFTISSSAASATGYGILINSGLSDITIANGHIRSGVTNNGSGVYSGSGFGYGIEYSGTEPMNALVSRVSVYGCLYDGIYLGIGNASAVENCTVNTVGGSGIEADSVAHSVALVCGSYAIFATTAQNSSASSLNSDGFHVLGTAENCSGTTAAATFYTGVYAEYAVLNCVGYATSGGYGIYTTEGENSFGDSVSGTGLDCNNAHNCYGYTRGNGFGLLAYGTAENCYGYSVSGPGLDCNNAQTCYGIGGGNYTGLYANGTAENCYGYNGNTGNGVYATIAVNCYGDGDGGDGVYAANAEGCYGTSSSGWGVYTTNTAQNCYGSGGYGGVSTFNAENCYGTCSGSGNGIFAFNAENCYGSSSYIAIYAWENALNCYGYGGSYGVYTSNAENCLGATYGGGDGIYATFTASGCFGQSSVTGVYAFIANACVGSSSDVPLDVIHNVNSYAF